MNMKIAMGYAQAFAMDPSIKFLPAKLSFKLSSEELFSLSMSIIGRSIGGANSLNSMAKKRTADNTPNISNHLINDKAMNIFMNFDEKVNSFITFSSLVSVLAIVLSICIAFIYIIMLAFIAIKGYI